VAASYNGKQWPEYDETYASFTTDTYSLEQEQEGNIRSVSFAGSMRPVKKLSVGAGFTKWFGRWKWRDAETEDYPVSLWREGTSHYNGQCVYVGVQGQVGRLSLGTTVYSPFRLMDEDIKDNYGWQEQAHQELDGAIHVGIAYLLSSDLTLGTGFGYQPGFALRHQESQSEYEDRYGASSELSCGIEYALNFKKTRLPIYFMYQARWMPQAAEFSFLHYYDTEESDEHALSNRFAAGTSLMFKRIGFHIAAHWSRRSEQATFVDYLLPPWS
jgi:hypothetical protein